MQDIEVMREPGESCHYCGKVVGKDIDAVGRLYDWIDPDHLRHSNLYCREHFVMVRKFQEESKARFLECYQSPESRAQLPEKSRELYNRLIKSKYRF